MMKQEYLFLTALLIVGILFISGCVQQPTIKPTTTTQPSETPTAQSTNNFLTYDSPAYGIRIGYPSDWTKSEQFMGSVVAFLSPTESTSDIFRENLNVIVQDLSTQPMTLDEYTELSVSQIKQFFTDANITDSSATTLDGNPAHKVVYTGKQGQYNLKWMQVWVVKENKAYIISYTAEVNKYPDFLGTIQQMINSFEII